jgi:putative ABC transport system permease protein
MRDALLMLALGIATGLLSVWALRRLVEAQLFGVTGFDTVTVATSAAGLALAVLAAATVPAWRAARINPVAALRDS